MPLRMGLLTARPRGPRETFFIASAEDPDASTRLLSTAPISDTGGDMTATPIPADDRRYGVGALVAQPARVTDKHNSDVTSTMKAQSATNNLPTCSAPHDRTTKTLRPSYQGVKKSLRALACREVGDARDVATDAFAATSAFEKVGRPEWVDCGSSLSALGCAKAAVCGPRLSAKGLNRSRGSGAPIQR